MSPEQAKAFKFEASSYSEPGALHPRRVIAWSSFPKDATRFTFAD